MKPLAFPLPDPIPAAPAGWQNLLNAEAEIPPQPEWLMGISASDWFALLVIPAIGTLLYVLVGMLCVAAWHDHFRTSGLRQSPRSKVLLGMFWPVVVPVYAGYRFLRALLFNL